MSHLGTFKKATSLSPIGTYIIGGKQMILKRLQVQTPLPEPTNCYIIADEIAKEAMVIDPGGEAGKIIEMLRVLNVNLKYIYLTHCHGDHIGALKELKKEMGGKILIHRVESENILNPEVTLSSYIGKDGVELEADSRVDEKDKIHIGAIEFEVIHTPGHTNGSTCLYAEKEKMLFSGDTMFHGTWGRCDLPTGSFEEIIKSITEKLLKLPDDTIVYPGHGKSTMIKEEKPIYIELKPRD